MLGAIVIAVLMITGCGRNVSRSFNCVETINGILCEEVEFNQGACYEDDNVLHCDALGSDPDVSIDIDLDIVVDVDVVVTEDETPVKYKGKKKCNNGGGNGSEGCSPSDHGNNDEI